MSCVPGRAVVTCPPTVRGDLGVHFDFGLMFGDHFGPGFDFETNFRPGFDFGTDFRPGFDFGANLGFFEA